MPSTGSTASKRSSGRRAVELGSDLIGLVRRCPRARCNGHRPASQLDGQVGPSAAVGMRFVGRDRAVRVERHLVRPGLRFHRHRRSRRSSSLSHTDSSSSATPDDRSFATVIGTNAPAVRDGCRTTSDDLRNTRLPPARRLIAWLRCSGDLNPGGSPISSAGFCLPRDDRTSSRRDFVSSRIRAADSGTSGTRPVSHRHRSAAMCPTRQAGRLSMIGMS